MKNGSTNCPGSGIILHRVAGNLDKESLKLTDTNSDYSTGLVVARSEIDNSIAERYIPATHIGARWLPQPQGRRLGP
jgi:hypothetical protein